MPPRETNELERRINVILERHGMTWRGAREMVQRVIRSSARSMPESELEERAQEVWLALFRYERTGQRIENLEALLVAMARRQAWEWLRRGRLWKQDSIDAADSSGRAIELPAPERGLDAGLLLLSIREHLYAVSPGCLRVLDLLFEGYGLDEVAAQIGKGHAAVRQQWSRCTSLIRDAFSADGGSLAAWLRSVGWGQP